GAIMANLGLWLRWSWRDLRARWLQVVVIALIISLGTAVFAGLGGQQTWREDSYDLSYSRLNMYDLQVEFADGSYLDNDGVLAALDGIEGIQTLETRLITPTLVDASHDDETVVVKGRIVGVDVSDGGPHVNGIFVDEDSGRTLTEADAGHNVAVVEYKFAKHYELKPGDPIRISGGVTLDFVGAGHSPEYFMVQPEAGSFFGEASFAVIFMPLETAQALADRAGMVNNVVLLLDDGADREVVRAKIEQRMEAAFPQTGIEILETKDDPVYSLLYTDAKGDQRTWEVVAFLFMFGAAMGAFNLAGRMVEAQRRQIGIGMALGVPRRWIAFRPLLVGVQIAVLGTIFGILIGLGLNLLFAEALRDLVPIPYYKISFYLPGYLQATLFGILLPFIATLIPVWRAVRVAPVDAITSGYLVAKGGGFSGLANHLPLPGKSFVHMPVKNILRSPWRSLLTVLGIAIAVMLMTSIVGFMDSYLETMARADDAYRYRGGDRVLVNLDFFYPVDNGEITEVTGLTGQDGEPLFTAAETALMLGGSLEDGDDKIDVLLELYDMDNTLWVPNLQAGELNSDEPGIIISEKTAADLDVDVGDSVTLEHPLREGLLAFRLIKTKLPVIGIHDNPLRPLAYMPLDDADLMGLEGVTNYIMLEPAKGVSEDDIKLALLDKPGVTSVKSIKEFSEAVEDLMSMITGLLAIVEGVVVVLAFLIAFNSTSISVDERVREIATMFAFGLRIRTVTRMQMLENLIIGVLGTLIGIGLGWLVINTLLLARVEQQMPDVKLTVTISGTTLILAAVLGVVVVMLTPLLSIRRMQQMDIPSTLRVME
ncbi:MAG: ABC transporter permease, partial [Anaerolineae bacterium]|nr:ABC transporter permease [Anaerolineae bacterium]